MGMWSPIPKDEMYIVDQCNAVENYKNECRDKMKKIEDLIEKKSNTSRNIMYNTTDSAEYNIEQGKLEGRFEVLQLLEKEGLLDFNG